MSSMYRGPAIQVSSEAVERSSPAEDVGENSRTRNSAHRTYRSRSEMPSRSHPNSQQGYRSMRGRSWTSSSDGEVAEEGIKANHARPRSPSSISRQRMMAKRALPGHSESVPLMAQSLHSHRIGPTKDAERSTSPEPQARPDVLRFLDSDSADLTEENIQRTVETTNLWHRDRISMISTSPRSSGPSSTSSTGSRWSRSGCDSEQDTEARTTPDSSVDGDIVSTTFTQGASGPEAKGYSPRSDSTTDSRHAPGRKETKEHRYGTPEMPRGNANLPHLPANALTPRVQNPGQGHVKHLPRAEKLPLTGYELLAARLSSSSGRDMPRSWRRGRTHSQSSSPGSDRTGRTNPDKEPAIKPIYRRFESLNHRLLLHLQDELSELEEQLHRLDTADTQTRRLQNCILPASRRAESQSCGELQWHKTDILGKIGFKLGQYNHVLSSFKDTQSLPSPSLSDVETYRTYLASDSPIAEIETRFLDPTDDLVSLARAGDDALRSRPSSSSSSSYCGRGGGAYSPAASASDEAATPRQSSLASFLPKTMRFPLPGAPGVAFLPTPSLSPVSSVASGSRPSTGAGGGLDQDPRHPVRLPAVGLACSIVALLVLLPVLLFQLVGGFSARLAFVVTLMAGTGVLGQVITANGQPECQRCFFGLTGSELLVCAAGYGAVLAVVAAVC